jgi:hypothetical protein
MLIHHNIEHTSLSYPSHPASSLRVVTWHTDTGKVQAAVIANAVASTPATSTTTSKKVQNKILYRTEVTGDTAAALKQLLRGLEGMSRQKFGNAGPGQIV